MFGRDSLCYGLVLLALCWYFAFGRFVKDTPRSYQHDTNVSDASELFSELTRHGKLLDMLIRCLYTYIYTYIYNINTHTHKIYI